MKLTKVISGGQTGVDQAALRAAHAAGVPTGGWAPKGWQTEAGPAPWLARYGLLPHAGGYAARTRANASESDATLILFEGGVTGGTALTVREVEGFARPCHMVNVGAVHGRHGEAAVAGVLAWLAAEGVATLNVAGPRESKHPGIGARAEGFLNEVFRALKEGA